MWRCGVTLEPAGRMEPADGDGAAAGLERRSHSGPDWWRLHASALQTQMFPLTTLTEPGQKGAQLQRAQLPSQG
ncbi:hypothetical protein AAFF_G00207130 [Aldrovandia affinis]|uniref:Uncharacterized protein n=1 Tax=Aldrovandia affinis TaxID=143900 RepID=A0AAD7W595_9TELE|nr:hypothetical protein AAFF_G00207130 [Aldrovandia affinis]